MLASLIEKQPGEGGIVLDDEQDRVSRSDLSPIIGYLLVGRDKRRAGGLILKQVQTLHGRLRGLMQARQGGRGLAPQAQRLEGADIGEWQVEVRRWIS